MRRDAWVAICLLGAGWVLILQVMPWSDERINDLGVYRVYADQMLAGNLPYRDFFIEYPPLSAPLLWLAGLPGTDYDVYRVSFAVLTFVLGVGVVLLCGELAGQTGGARRRALYAAALMPVVGGAMLRTHFDLAPIAITLGALWLLCVERPRSGLALLGVGTLVKGFPLVAVPVALAWLVGRGLRRDAWQGAAACGAVVVAVSGVAFALSPDGALDAVDYHLGRPVQIESAPAVAALGLDRLGIGDSDVRSSHGSEGVHHPAAGALEIFFTLALLAAIAALAFAAARDGSTRTLVLASLTAVAAFAVLGKVLSPQFMTWVIPLGALAFAWRLHALATALVMALVLTLVEFPAHYFDYVHGDRAVMLLVAARDAVLLACLALAFVALHRCREEQLLDRRRAAVAPGVD